MRKLIRTSRLVVIALLIGGQVGCSAGAGAGAGGGGAAISKSSRAQLVKAQKAIDAKRYDEAIKLCDTVIAAEPENAEAYKVRGLARMSIPMGPSRPPPAATIWNSHRPRYGEEAFFIRRAPARKDLEKAGELRDHKDPVVWYLLSVLHTDIARNSWDWAPVEHLENAIEALEQAEKLDQKNPAYGRAREVLVPQLYFAQREHASGQMPYNGEYADVIPMTGKEPYGESMKRIGWVPGTTWTPPPAGTSARNRGAGGSSGSSSGSSDDDASMYILLGIGAVLLMSGLSDRSGGSGAGGGSRGFETCSTCRGGKYFNDYDYARKVPLLRPCGSCNGTGFAR